MKSIIKSVLIVLFFTPDSVYTNIQPKFPFTLKMSSMQQVCGIYKMALGSAMMAYGSYSIAQSTYTNPYYGMNKLFDTQAYNFLTIFLGAHMVYFGLREFNQKQNSSIFFKIQEEFVNSLAVLQGMTLAQKAFLIFKSRPKI